MTNFIRHIVEPKRLALAWQAHDGVGIRDCLEVGSLFRLDAQRIGFRYAFDTADAQAALALGFTGHPAFKRMNRLYDADVLTTFMRRLPPRSRSDFGQYLSQLRLSDDVTLTDFALLGYSGARLPSDGFSLVHTFDDANGPFEMVMEIAGTRYQHDHRCDQLEIGQSVHFEREPNNPKDSQAIRVNVEGRCIGYVNRLLLSAMHRWLTTCQVEASVERVNGTTDRPLVYVFVKVLPLLHRLAA